jgi:hypothetical protein
MQLNGSPLNALPLNALAAAVTYTVPVVKGDSYRWKLLVLIGGVDMSSRLTGTVTVDRERGSAGVATLVLQLLPGAVVPSDWIGRTVTIHYVSTALGETTLSLRFTGRIVKTDWDSLTRTLSCQCSDQLQQRVEALEVTAIDALTGGYWSPDVFEAVDGRSRWDYALERMGTIPASLDSAADGTLRVSSWYAAATPDFVFGPDTTVYESIRVSYAELTNLTNTVKIEADYRFARLWQWNIHYGWVHPGLGGSSGEAGFCNWRQDDTELPTIDMVQSATESSGQTLLAGASYQLLPPSGVYCDPPQGWTNNFTDLLLAAGWVGGRRWNQPVTMQYRINVVAEASVAAAGEVIGRERVALEVQNDTSEAWESGEFTGGTTGQTDVIDEARRVSALECILHQAATTVIGAHTQTEVSWDVPTSMVMGVDLTHTLRLEDQNVGAQARCSRVNDSFDMASAIAITTLSISVMRGGGTVSDPLTAPAFAGYVPSPGDPEDQDKILPTQLGGRNESPIYDEEKLGFSGNYTENDLDINPDLELFPRRLDLEAPEIAEALRDEKATEVPVTYRVAIPNDWLEL